MGKIIFGISVILLANISFAEITVEQYKESLSNESTKKIMGLYIAGLGDGFFLASAASKSLDNKDLYCPPSNFVLTFDNYIKVLNQEIDGGDHTKDTPVGVVLFIGLQKTFPCN